MTSFNNLPLKEQVRISSCMPKGSTFIGAESTKDIVYVTYELNGKIERFSYKGSFIDDAELRRPDKYTEAKIISFVTTTGEIKFAAENSPYYFSLFDKYHLASGVLNA